MNEEKNEKESDNESVKYAICNLAASIFPTLIGTEREVDDALARSFEYAALFVAYADEFMDHDKDQGDDE